MFAAIRNFLIRRKKEQLRHKNDNKPQPVDYHDTPSTSTQAPDEFMEQIQSVQAVPYWYQMNSSFDNVHIQYPPENLKPPHIDTVMRERLKDYVRDISPEPDGSMALYAKLNDPNASVKEISALVASDPILAAHILKLVNSAAFGLT